MNLKDFLDTLYCWEGDIVVYNKDYVKLSKFYYPNETCSEKYLNWRVVAITPNYTILTKCVVMYPLIEIVVKEA